MGQLDLFGLGPQQDITPKRKVKTSGNFMQEGQDDRLKGELTVDYSLAPETPESETVEVQSKLFASTENTENDGSPISPEVLSEAENIRSDAMAGNAEDVDPPLERIGSNNETLEKLSENIIHSQTVRPDKENPVVFTDGKIGVKFKIKKLQEVEPAPEVEELEEPAIKIQRITQKRGRKSFKELDAQVDLIEIPEDEVLYQKQYYPISTVASWFKVNTSLLRFWENEFDILKPRKNRKGDRMFRPEDVKNLQLIHHLLREKKYTIDGARDFLKGNKRKAETQLQLTQTLQKFKLFLLELKANL